MNALNSTERVTLSSSDIDPVFGKVFYQNVGSNIEVTFTILMPRISEGWKTGVALDASSSMRAAYGKSSKPTENLVEMEARKFLYYLADRLDAEVKQRLFIGLVVAVDSLRCWEISKLHNATR